MIKIEGTESNLKDALEALAYRIVMMQHYTWYDAPEEEVINILNGECGIHAEKEDY